jgi:hypothetical protein
MEQHASCVDAGIFLGLMNPEDGGDILLENSRFHENFFSVYYTLNMEATFSSETVVSSAYLA